VLGRCPRGAKRTLKHLPTQVLRQQNYRLLIQLLDDPDSANVLHHASKIDDLAIAVLAELPQPLRRALRDHGQLWHRINIAADTREAAVLAAAGGGRQLPRPAQLNVNGTA
jgi:hypothetical protein